MPVAPCARVHPARVGGVARFVTNYDARWRVNSTADHLKSTDEHHSPEVTDILKAGDEGEGQRRSLKPKWMPDRADKHPPQAAAAAASLLPPARLCKGPPRPILPAVSAPAQMWRS